MKDVSYFLKANPRDVEILYLVHLFRFLPLKTLSNLLIRRGTYTKYQAVSRNIKRLIKFRYLRERKYDFNAKFLFLSSLGADVLSHQRPIPREYINTPVRLAGVNLFAIEHTLKVVEIYELFYAESKKHNFEIIEFKGDGSVRFLVEFRDNLLGKKIKKYILPDALVRIQKDDEIKTYFIEYDKGTEYSKDVATKYTKYFQYFEYDENWKDMFGEFPTIIFIVEKTRKRILNLIPTENFPNLNNFPRKEDYLRCSNVVIKSIGLHENINSTGSSIINEFLEPDRFLFIDMPTLQKEGLEAKLLNYKQKEVQLFSNNSDLKNL